MPVKSVIAGLGGAIALNILHESLKKTGYNVPRIDLLGEEALQKSLSAFGYSIKSERNLYLATLGADVISNGIYYGLIGSGKKKHIWPNAITLGFAAGIGALLLPKQLGLNPEPVNRSVQTRLMTVGYYLTGAIITAVILQAAKRKTK